MTRKKTTTRQTEPQSPWVEIVPQPWKEVKKHYRCCVCDRDLPIMVKDRLEIVPAAYLAQTQHLNHEPPTAWDTLSNNDLWRGHLLEHCELFLGVR